MNKDVDQDIYDEREEFEHSNKRRKLKEEEKKPDRAINAEE